tara:strand:- start:352 stop:1347 length:996 start_codon:yes stop_codon:yes gene_type:complete
MSALPSAPNSLSINQIAQEFGGDTPHAISEYYAGGDNVPAGTQGEGGGIPSSGSAISIGDFFGSRQRVTINLTISSNVNNYQISQQRGGSYEAGFTDITVTNNSGIVVGSTAVGTASLATGAAPNYASGDTIKIVNNGSIVGKGGNGGAGMANNGTGVAAGQAAGDAIDIAFPTTVQNASGAKIEGAGGGGGGGGRGSTVQPGQPGNPPSQSGGKSQGQQPGQPSNPPATQFFGGGGGGGGSGRGSGSGGAGGSSQGQAGQIGQDTSPFSGGAGGDSTGQTNPNGGAGGGRGQAGQAGQQGGGAGAAGKAVEPNGNQLTIQNSGQVVGSTS